MTLRRVLLTCAICGCAKQPIEAPAPTTTTTPIAVVDAPDAALDASADVATETSSAAATSSEPRTISARHILVRVGDFPGKKKRTLRQAHAVIDEVKKRLAAGEDFADLAKLYSEDPSTARAGGDIGPFPRGQMVKEFEDAAFALAPYEMTVVETVFGVHLVQRTR